MKALFVMLACVIGVNALWVAGYIGLAVVVTIVGLSYAIADCFN